jgi:hypothetical protein
MTTTIPLSPVELLKDYLVDEIGHEVPGGIVVGPLSDEQQQKGGISVMAAGLPKREKYVPVMWQRLQLRVIAPSLDIADAIAQHAFAALDEKSRIIMTQTSTGSQYLVHYIGVSGGPSMHFDSPETWEDLLFAEVMVGTQPISTS